MNSKSIDWDRRKQYLDKHSERGRMEEFFINHPKLISKFIAWAEKNGVKTSRIYFRPWMYDYVFSDEFIEDEI